MNTLSTSWEILNEHTNDMIEIPILGIIKLASDDELFSNNFIAIRPMEHIPFPIHIPVPNDKGIIIAVLINLLFIFHVCELNYLQVG